ncbi:MAG: RIP metalloprotease RseP [Candidatus Adiutrix sp.]|jgi:regulator of sigma E protease|nr:RIP metalloprotease RseP [Candidatus Adiutrix sp.]
MDFITSFAQTGAAFVVVLLVLIFIHELGHFTAAKLLGVRVERFSLGFPPKAWSKTIGETEYQLAWLPLGGYVKMYGEDPTAEEQVSPELMHRSFSHKPPWAKMIIVLAGPVANIIFAIFLFWGLTWFSGIGHLAPIAGHVTPGGAAEKAGLMTGDVITAIHDGQAIQYYDELETALSSAAGKPIDITYKRQGQPEARASLAPAVIHSKDLLGDPITIYDIGLEPLVPPVVERVLDGTPAEKAGLLSGDQLVAINGQALRTWEDVLNIIQGPRETRAALEAPTVRPLSIELLRDGAAMTLEITPELNVSQNISGQTTYTPMVGMSPRVEILSEPVGFFQAAYLGLADTLNMTKMTLIGLGKMISGQVSAKTLGGPLLIAEVSGESAREGLASLLRLAAFISVNLGILNLLPIPVLDGGQFVFFVIEAIRRKPVSLRIREVGQWIGMGFLGLLMITVFYNDIARLITRFSTKTQVEAPAVVDQ